VLREKGKVLSELNILKVKNIEEKFPIQKKRNEKICHLPTAS